MTGKNYRVTRVVGDYRVHHQLSDLHFVVFDLYVPAASPDSAWAAANLAELAQHLGNKVELPKSKSTKDSLRGTDPPCRVLVVIDCNL